MDVKVVAFIIIILGLLYVILRFIMKGANTLTGLMSGTTTQTISPTSLPNASSSTVASANFAYTIWFYVNDWNYQYGSVKPVIVVGNSGNKKDLTIDFAPSENNILVTLKVDSPGYKAPLGGATGANPPAATQTTVMMVSNFPIQKWVNFTISVYGKTLDAYLDGKLVQSQLLPGIANVSTADNIYITPAGGFSGWTSKFGYYPNALNPQDVWSIYQSGYGANWFSNIFGQYSIKISVLANGTENSSLTI